MEKWSWISLLLRLTYLHSFKLAFQATLHSFLTQLHIPNIQNHFPTFGCISTQTGGTCTNNGALANKSVDRCPVGPWRSLWTSTARRTDEENRSIIITTSQPIYRIVSTNLSTNLWANLSINKSIKSVKYKIKSWGISNRGTNRSEVTSFPLKTCNSATIFSEEAPWR